MKKLIYLCFAIVCLSGCFAENYSVGHPITKLEVNKSKYNLQPSQIGWNTQGDTTSLKENDIESLLSKSEKIVVSSGQILKITFEDSIEDEGQYTDIKIKISGTKNGDKQLLYESEIESSMLEEIHSFAVPTEKGEYILEVEFTSNGNFAEYIGDLHVE
ncbi:hypothetical protein DCE79_02710 [Lysinibacillus sp. 2017]|uniref:hypothetical protein n=1 Tax=unclassified Lysinibacillus TaxID=2636778 RepID=UPI000D528CC5|nr:MULTISPECIES: hypothetical protein [unclassified Lysinibacillus]AWE06360.1 hypothetical protein DCE79_02710 [Lysinibacillus sp. 2017]TGN31162.1 hypothetical protein E4L99_16970 [Lysinibacillus sp. S2017]